MIVAHGTELCVVDENVLSAAAACLAAALPGRRPIVAVVAMLRTKGTDSGCSGQQVASTYGSEYLWRAMLRWMVATAKLNSRPLVTVN